jgi:NACHT domain/Sulfatase-modifying factor enzyme 1
MHAGHTPESAWLPRIGWLLAALSLPSVVATTGRHLVVRHPVFAVALLLAYWTLLIVARFAGNVWSKLSGIWSDRVAEHVDQAWARRFSNFSQRYNSYVLSSVRFIDQRGLPTVGFYTPDLDDVFVHVSLVRRAPHQVPTDPLAPLPPDVRGRLSIDSLLDGAKPSVLAVTGAPGTGKTTLLRHTARNICNSHHRRRGVPILLCLRDHVHAIVHGHEGLPDVARNTLGQYAPEPEGWFDQRLRDGKCVVMLDGLDEVASDKDRRIVSAWVEHQIALYPDNDYVITSRPHGYLAAPVQGADVLQVCRFTDEQVNRFVHVWYLAVERHSTGTDGVDVRRLAQSEARDLLDRLRASPALYELTVNPLLLTMIANVHKFRGALPGSRSELYRDICEVMLWRRHEAKKLASGLSGERKEALLRRLAFEMMQRKVSDLAAAEIVAVIGTQLSRMSSSYSAADFLADVGSNGLFIERESGIYAFAHQTFQEYLAATYIRDKGLVAVLAEAVNDTWWRELTLLYVARADADPIIQASLDSGSVAALTLAFDCAEEKPDLAPELQKRLDELLAGVPDSQASPEHSRLVARVMIIRLLRHMVSADGGQLCAQPVTVGVYQRFLNDIDSLGVSRKSDGPRSSRAEDVVAGVRGEDAVAFAEWVNDLLGERAYRLPTRGELESASRNRAFGEQSYPVWLHSRTGLPERWTAKGSDQPYRIEASAITCRFFGDISHLDTLVPVLLLRRAVILLSLVSPILRFGHQGSHASSIARELTREVEFSLDMTSRHTGTAYLGMELEITQARDLAYHLRLHLESDRARGARGHTVDDDIDGALKLADDLGDTLDRALTHMAALDQRVVHLLALDLNATSYRSFDTKRIIKIFGAGNTINAAEVDKALNQVSVDVMGETLSTCLTVGLRSIEYERGAVGQLRASFDKALVRNLNTRSTDFEISLDRMPKKIQALRMALVRRDSEPPAFPGLWCGSVAERFAQTAMPIFSRTRRLDRQTASILRLTSLSLAAETYAHRENGLSDICWELAAGVTLLEQRVCGEGRPLETIILARA